MRLPALRQLSLNERQGAAFGQLVDVDAGADMDGGDITQDGFVAQHFGQAARLRADDHHSFAVVQRLAAILHEGAQPPAVGVGAGEARHEMFGATLVVGVKFALAGREYVGETQLAQLCQARLQLAPGDVRGAQLRGVLAVILEARLHLLRLRVQLHDTVLDAFGVVQDQQAAFGQVVQHAGLRVQVGQVEGDIVEGAFMAQVFQVALPAFFGVVMQHGDVQLLEHAWPPPARAVAGLRARARSRTRRWD